MEHGKAAGSVHVEDARVFVRDFDLSPTPTPQTIGVNCRVSVPPKQTQGVSLVQELAWLKEKP